MKKLDNQMQRTSISTSILPARQKFGLFLLFYALRISELVGLNTFVLAGDGTSLFACATNWNPVTLSLCKLSWEAIIAGNASIYEGSEEWRISGRVNSGKSAGTSFSAVSSSHRFDCGCEECKKKYGSSKTN